MKINLFNGYKPYFYGNSTKRSKEETEHLEELKHRLDWANLSKEEKLANAKRYIEGRQNNLHQVCLPVRGSNGTKTQIFSVNGQQFEDYKKLQARADSDIDSISGLDDSFRKQLNALVVDVGIKTKEHRKTYEGKTFVITDKVVEQNKAYADFALFGYSTPDKLVKRYKMHVATIQNPELSKKSRLYNPSLPQNSEVMLEARKAKSELAEKMKLVSEPTQEELDGFCRSKFNNFQQLLDDNKSSFVLDNQKGSGLFAQAFVKYKNPEDKNSGIDEIVVAVRGSDNFPDIKDDYKMFILGHKGEQLDELSEFYKNIRAKVGDEPLVTFAGHSLGGGLSSLMAYKFRDDKVKAYGQCAPDVFDVVYNHQSEFGFDKEIVNPKEFAKVLANSGADITLFNNSGDVLTRDGVYAGAKIYLYDHLKSGISHHQVLDSKKLASSVKPSTYDSF